MSVRVSVPVCSPGSWWWWAGSGRASLCRAPSPQARGIVGSPQLPVFSALGPVTFHHGWAGCLRDLRGALRLWGLERVGDDQRQVVWGPTLALLEP